MALLVNLPDLAAAGGLLLRLLRQLRFLVLVFLLVAGGRGLVVVLLVLFLLPAVAVVEKDQRVGTGRFEGGVVLVREPG